jgi:hypothetical protein
MSNLHPSYDDVCEHVDECIKTYFETNFSEIEDEDELDEEIQSAFNDSVFTDHFSSDDIDGWDVLAMVRFISNYYREEFGDIFCLHEKSDKDIINLFALLHAEEYKHKFLKDKKPKQQ